MYCQMCTGAVTAYTADSTAKLSTNQSFSTKLYNHLTECQTFFPLLNKADYHYLKKKTNKEINEIINIFYQQKIAAPVF